MAWNALTSVALRIAPTGACDDDNVVPDDENDDDYGDENCDGR